MAHNRREKVKQMISELKEAGIITDSDSPYSSPILQAPLYRLQKIKLNYREGQATVTTY